MNEEFEIWSVSRIGGLSGATVDFSGAIFAVSNDPELTSAIVAEGATATVVTASDRLSRLQDGIVDLVSSRDPNELLPLIAADETLLLYKASATVSGILEVSEVSPGALFGSLQPEAISGTAGSDSIYGLEGDDQIDGGGGGDLLDGGPGTDTAVFGGNRNDYTLTLSADSATLSSRVTAPGVRDTLVGMESIAFDNDVMFDLELFGGTVNLSEDQLAGFVELYIAYFNRAPDAIGLGFWGTAFANGTSLERSAEFFIDQAETRQLYPDDLSNADFVTAVYNNVLGRPADQAGFDFWVNGLDSGGVTRDQFILEILRGAKAPPPDGASQDFITQQQADRDFLSDKTDIGVYYAVINGLSGVEDAVRVMSLFDGSAQSKNEAAFETLRLLAKAEGNDPGQFLLKVSGVASNPFPDLLPNTAANVFLTNVATSLADTADTTDRIKVADIIIVDDRLGMNVLSLSGADAALFEIEGLELFLSAGVPLDTRSNPTLEVSVDVDDPAIIGTPDATARFALALTDVLDGPIELSEIQQDADPRGFAINGVSGNFIDVSNAGDVNGDGLDDLIVGAPNRSPNGAFSGASFVVFGKADGIAVEISDIESGIGGFVINGVAADHESGSSVSGAGDVNGDGLADLIVGAPADNPNGIRSGASFVVFGKADGTAVELSDVEGGSGGFVINGASEFYNIGLSVSTAGDVNGDGLDDMVFGGPRVDAPGFDSGASFVVFGKADGTPVEISDIEDGSGGFAINGVSANQLSGSSVSTAGDVNGDGLDDLIIGAAFATPNGTFSGASFVVFGKADGATVELPDIADGIGGFVINGVSERDFSGGSVSTAGDVNGDGLDDLIVGASRDDPNGESSGASFVVFGKADGAAVELSDVEGGIGGFVMNGVSAEDTSGSSVSVAGDVNGDGFDDVIVGARESQFVVFGSNFTGAATEIGTADSDVFFGSLGADNIFGAQGADHLIQSAGQDRFTGGSGADWLLVQDVVGNTEFVDYSRSEGDQIDVRAFGFTAFSQMETLLSPDGPGGQNTRIDFDMDTSVVLIGVSLSDLGALDFVFR